MTVPQISFQVRTRSAASLAEIAARVGAALGCSFEASHDASFEPGDAFEARLLGLQISVSKIIVLSDDDDAPAGDGSQTYVVMGGLHPDLEEDWQREGPPQSISEYIRGLMTTVDGDGWYVPTRHELLAEAGIAHG
jgi:hypothetical protein